MRGRWRRFGAAIVALGALACGGAAPEATAVVLVVPDDPRAAHLSLRVWDTAGELVADHFFEVGPGPDAVELPWRVPLVPRMDQDARWFRAELELFDDAYCPYARAVVRDTYAPGAVDERSVSMAPTALDGCAAVFVDPVDGDAGECADPASPCADLEASLDAHVRPDRPEVFYLRGERDYLVASGGLRLNRARAGEPGSPVVIRAWPGTGAPRIRPRDLADATIEICCTDQAGRHLVLDGLDVSGGIRWGLSVNARGAGPLDNVVRNSVIHGNGLDELGGPGLDEPRATRGLDTGVMLINEAEGTTVEHNVIRDNGAPGFSGAGVIVMGDSGGVIRGNVIRGNSRVGVWVLRAPGADLAVTVEGNVVCDNAADGVRIDRPTVRTERNSIVGNGARGIELIDAAPPPTAPVRENLVALNLGEGLADRISDERSWLHGNADGRTDGDPRLFDPDACVLSLRAGSPALGSLPDGASPGAY